LIPFEKADSANSEIWDKFIYLFQWIHKIQSYVQLSYEIPLTFQTLRKMHQFY